MTARKPSAAPSPPEDPPEVTTQSGERLLLSPDGDEMLIVAAGVQALLNLGWLYADEPDEPDEPR